MHFFCSTLLRIYFLWSTCSTPHVLTILSPYILLYYSKPKMCRRQIRSASQKVSSPINPPAICALRPLVPTICTTHTHTAPTWYSASPPNRRRQMWVTPFWTFIHKYLNISSNPRRAHRITRPDKEYLTKQRNRKQIRPNNANIMIAPPRTSLLPSLADQKTIYLVNISRVMAWRALITKPRQTDDVARPAMGMRFTAAVVAHHSRQELHRWCDTHAYHLHILTHTTAPSARRGRDVSHISSKRKCI